MTRRADPTLAQLTEQLAVIAAEAAAEGIGPDDVRNRRKVLIFSYFADTVDWIHDHLIEVVAADERLACYRGRVASLSGTSGAGDKDGVIWGFAPRTTEPPGGRDEDLYDIVVTTDVLAEGVNLQQARHIVNYDLPWNPMRLVQRHGRIDRIGSLHKEVFIHCVFPDARLDDLLNLEDRLRRKLAQAAASIGVGEVLPDQTGRDLSFTETREEIERIRSQDAGLFERGGTVRGAQSGEEYRQELRQAIEQGQQERIEALPWGSGSGMAAPPGCDGPAYVFCVRVGDWPQTIFRYVDAAGGAPVGDTLACLHRARPPGGPATPHRLDEATHHGAFEAWETARADVVERWNHLADKANLEPQIPPALQRAAEVVRSHPPDGLTQDEVDRAVDALSAPYTERIIRTVRAALTGETPAEQARNVVGVIENLGLEPYTPPEPLPPITPADVHLVCWLALV